MDIHKIKILRKYEIYCYRICHYLLQGEAHAIRAAENALLQIAVDASFFSESDEARKEKILRTSIRSSLLQQEKSATM